jgi:hypothetical protein
LQIVTAAGDKSRASKEQLCLDSQINRAGIVVLANDTSYYEGLEQAAKIRKYIKQKNVAQLPESTQGIIRGRNQQASILEKNAEIQIEKAVIGGTFYVFGESVELKYGDAKTILDELLKRLIDGVYSKLAFINTFYDGDADILSILNGAPERLSLTGTGANNEDALSEMSQWLEAQQQMHTPVSMADIQKRYQAVPYGWREFEIAAVVARMIVLQRVDIRYGGAVVGRDDRRLVDYLRKKSETDKASVTRRVAPSEDLKRKSVAFLRDWLGFMNVPDDDDGLIRYVIDSLREKSEHYERLITEYAHGRYPERESVENASNLVRDILSQKSDNIALLTRLIDRQDKLRDMTEDMEPIETFFKSQRAIYDAARDLLDNLQNDRDCFIADVATNGKINEIHTILAAPKPYGRIKELPELMQAVRVAHAALLEQKKDEVLGVITQCMGDVHTLAGSSGKAKDEITRSDGEFAARKKQAAEATSLTVLDALIQRLYAYKDSVCKRIEVMIRPTVFAGGQSGAAVKTPKIVQVRRYEVFPVKRLETPEDVDAYLDGLRKKLLEILKDNDGIQIN